MSETPSLSELIRIHSDALCAAQDEHARIVFELTLTPGDAELTKQQAEIAAERASVSTRLESLRVALSGESIAAKRKRIEREESEIKQAQQVIDDTEPSLAAINSELFDAVSKVCAVLHRRQTVSAVRKKAAKTIDRHSVANDEKYGLYSGIRLEEDAAGDAYVAGVLLDLLYDAGFGRTGLQFPQHLLNVQPARIGMTIEQATEKGSVKFRDLVLLKLSRRPANVRARAIRETELNPQQQRTADRMRDLADDTRRKRKELQGRQVESANPTPSVRGSGPMWRKRGAQS